MSEPNDKPPTPSPPRRLTAKRLTLLVRLLCELAPELEDDAEREQLGQTLRLAVRVAQVRHAELVEQREVARG